MTIKTMTVPTGGGLYTVGWHELKITKAEYGIWKSSGGDGKRYIDLWFEKYPDNSNLRIYETKNKTTGEEFKIAGLFRYANAGIMDVLKDPTGKKPVIQYDDEASGLIGKNINVYFYKETKTGNNYTRMNDSIAPVEQEGEKLSYTESDVTSIKNATEANFQKRFGNTPANGAFTEFPKTETKKPDLDNVPF